VLQVNLTLQIKVTHCMKRETEFLDSDSVIEIIHTKIQRSGYSGLLFLDKMVTFIEENIDKKIELKEELSDFLAEYGIFLNKTESNELSRNLDQTGENIIDYSEFESLVLPRISETRISAIKQYFNGISNGLASISGSVFSKAMLNRNKPMMIAVKKTPESILTHDIVRVLGKAEFVDMNLIILFFREFGRKIESDDDFIAVLKQIVLK